MFKVVVFYRHKEGFDESTLYSLNAKLAEYRCQNGCAEEKTGNFTMQMRKANPLSQVRLYMRRFGRIWKP